MSFDLECQLGHCKFPKVIDSFSQFLKPSKRHRHSVLGARVSFFGVYLTGVNFSSGAELSRVFHISLVEIITVLFGDGSHGDLGGPDRVGVAGGVVVLRHPPSGDLAVPPPQPADRVVLLHRGTDGFDVGPERDEAASRVPVAVVVVNLTGVALGQKGRSEDVSNQKEAFHWQNFNQ